MWKEATGGQFSATVGNSRRGVATNLMNKKKERARMDEITLVAKGRKRNFNFQKKCKAPESTVERHICQGKLGKSL